MFLEQPFGPGSAEAPSHFNFLFPSRPAVPPPVPPQVPGAEEPVEPDLGETCTTSLASLTIESLAEADPQPELLLVTCPDKH